MKRRRRWKLGSKRMTRQKRMRRWKVVCTAGVAGGVVVVTGARRYKWVEIAKSMGMDFPGVAESALVQTTCLAVVGGELLLSLAVQRVIGDWRHLTSIIGLCLLAGQAHLTSIIHSSLH